MDFILDLKSRNEILFYFGSANLMLSIILLLISIYLPIELNSTNAWYKPIKFALSIGIYSLSMAWYMHYLPSAKVVELCSWIIVVMLGLEIIYIVVQASRGQLSHFNHSTALYSNLYILMAIAATVVAFVSLYIGILFCTTSFPDLPAYYIWSIRFALFLFFIFSMEGFVMGANLSHTIGAEDGGQGLPFLNRSTRFGDARVAHFIGMHALQVLPLLAFFVLKSTKLTIIVSLAYLLLACLMLIQALQAKPLIKL
jgi:hypothetical protein